MIGILIEGEDEHLETFPDTSITVKLENPLFWDPERISPGSFSLPFDLPAAEASPKNAAQFDNPDVIENNVVSTSKIATLFFEIPIRKGKIRSTDGSDKRSQSYFTWGLNNIRDDFKTVKLSTVLSESIVISATEITKKVHIKRVTAGDITLTVNGNTYTQPNTGLGLVDMSVETSAAAFHITLDKPDVWSPKVIPGAGPTSGGIDGTFATVKLVQFYTISEGVYGERDCTDPLVELHVTVDEVADYIAEGDLGVYWDALKDFVNAYQEEGAYPTDKFRFPVVFNANLYDGKTPKESEAINLVNADGLIVNDPSWGLSNDSPLTMKNYNSIQPFLMLQYVLDRIGTYFGFTWTSDFDVSDFLLWNTHTLDLQQKYIGESDFVFWKRSFNINELAPDISVVAFLKALQTRYNLGIFFNENTNQVSIVKREPIALSLPYEDITSISSIIQNYKSERVEGIELRLKKDDTDKLSQEESNLTGTRAEEKIDLSCGRLFDSTTKLFSGEPVEAPRVSQVLDAKGMMRMFHYRGIIETDTYNYPGAAISSESVDETIDGIHEDFYKYWLLFEKNRMTLKVASEYELRQLINYDFTLKRRYDRSKFLVKSIDYKLVNNSMSVSSVELYTMK